MDSRFVFPIVMATIVVFIALAGCTSPSGTPAATQIPVPTTIQTPAPATTAPVVTTTVKATVTAEKTQTYVEEVILHQKGMLSPTIFQTYNLQTIKDQFFSDSERNIKSLVNSPEIISHRSLLERT